MGIDKNLIKKNADRLIVSMKKGYQYTLTRLQVITSFSATELCLALLVLIQENKVEQYKCDDGVRYALC